MTDREYMKADAEVIRMVNRGRGPGGELPSLGVTFIPTARAAKAEALDHRIQQLQRILPYVYAATLLLSGLLIGRAM